jgi:hypothetical protein
VKPPADDVDRLKPELLQAYAKVCPDVTSVQSELTSFRPHGELILVRCPDQPVKAVRLHYTRVVVPNLLGHEVGMQEPQTVLAMLGLHWRITHCCAGDSGSSGIVRQSPAPRSVVPFGTTVAVVIHR